MNFLMGFFFYIFLLSHINFVYTGERYYNVQNNIWILLDEQLYLEYIFMNVMKLEI